jgi:MoaA/NifB/PqqE/SkfB family radical SAM enzyme
MCNIWTLPDSVPDLQAQEWTALLASDLLRDLRELDITGGEPFLRDDLTAIVRSIASLKATHLKRLRSVAITTNGLLTDRVIGMVAEWLPLLAEARLQLVMVIGLDAVDETHDRIRRHPGAWTKVDRTVTSILALRNEHPNLIAGIKVTVIPHNLDQLDRIAQYARERGLFAIVSPAIATAGRYLNLDRAPILALGPAARARLAAFFERSGVEWSLHAETVARFLRGRHMRKPCTCGFNYFFVRSSGEVFLCPLFVESVGNIAQESPASVFGSVRASAVRRRIGRSPECSRCTEPGLERYSLPYEGFTYLRLLLRLGPREFIALHRRMGLDKYV